MAPRPPPPAASAATLRCARTGAAAVLAMAAALTAGCRQPRRFTLGHFTGRDKEIVSAPAGATSIYRLAGRLGMTIEAAGASWATLRDRANSVLVFAGPCPSVYVNGQVLDAFGDIRTVGDIIFVPLALAEQISPLLRRPGEPVAPPPPKPARPTCSIGKVVLDPGHGGKDPGAISPLGFSEKSIVLPTTLDVARLLEAEGAEVVLTRTTDVFIPLDERADIANRSQADLFVSIHADSARNAGARGFTVYVCPSASRRTLAAAQAIHDRLAQACSDGRGIRQAGFRVLVRTTCPAVLVELGYLSNRAEASRLADAGYRRRLAEALAEAVAEFLRR